MAEFQFVEVKKDSLALRFFYKTVLGRVLLKPLILPGFSKLGGKVMDSAFSKSIIPFFVRKNGIVLSDYEKEEYGCFNDFFCRRIRKELRPIESDDNAFVSPVDGYLSVYPIHEQLVMPVKHSSYSVKDLLQDEELANQYNEGVCFVFRLCVHHYHRFHFNDDGKKIKQVKINGLFHTVRPIATRNEKVFIQNAREYSVLDTKNFGQIVQMEVGAMLVGKIDNLPVDSFVRGQEKGRFLYGGSTVIVLVKKDVLDVEEWMFNAEGNNQEIDVRMGQTLCYIKNR